MATWRGQLSFGMDIVFVCLITSFKSLLKTVKILEFASSLPTDSVSHFEKDKILIDRNLKVIRNVPHHLLEAPLSA